MNHFFKSLLWFFLFATLAFFLHYYLGERLCGSCKEKQTNLMNQNTTGHWSTFSIANSDGQHIFTFPEGFLTHPNDGNVTIPESLAGFKDSILDYLNINQGKELMISGKYIAPESETRGMDRANFLKDILVKFGVNGDKITPKAILSEYAYDDSGNYGAGISMVFQNIPDENIQIIEKNIANKTLYADFGNVDFIADNTLIVYAKELKDYLTKYPDKSVVITGHTDNVGTPNSNYNFGLKRANNVRDYLVSQGIDASKMTTVSKGQTEPIAENNTEAGKAQNRRINIIVK